MLDTILRFCVWCCLGVVICSRTWQTPQEEFCEAPIVIKARLLPYGSIVANNGNVGPDMEPYYVGLEIRVLEVFKTNRHHSTLTTMQDSLHYAKTKDTRTNADADGWDFGGMYEYVTGEETLLYFNDWSNINILANSDWWRGVSNFQRNVLKKAGYDCTCSVDECQDRLHGTVGLPTCQGEYDIRDAVKQMACSPNDSDNECTWKGARSSCVNPNNTEKKKKRKLKH